jgi:glycosyltransferase involved in cell wall biosynthesis
VENIEYENEINKGSFHKLRMGIKVIYSLEARKKLLQLIEAEEPDIAHIHKFNNTLTPSILYVLKKKNVPVVQTLHDYRTVCPNYNMYDFNKREVCGDCKGHKYFNALKRKCQKSSYLIGLNIAIESYLYHFLKTYQKTINLFISPSRFLKMKMVEFGIDSNKIVYIPNFIDCRDYMPTYNSSNYILYFGRIENHKGVKTLVHAMEKAKTLKLYIVGEGGYLGKLKAYVAEKKLKNVEFFPHKPRNELNNIIKWSLFTVIPSEWYENCPMAVLESFAFGKPVIGANIGGIPDLVDDRVNGLLFKAGDRTDLAEKINYLSSNRHLISEMGRNARKKIEVKYDENSHCQKLIQAYGKII